MANKFNRADYEVGIPNPELYDRLLDDYLSGASKEVKNLFWSNQDIEFYTGFRKWTAEKYNCFNDGSNSLFFKTEQDYVWFRLKYG